MINNSYLLGLYGLTGATTSPQAVSRARTQPTAPWEAGGKAPEQSALLRAALSGRRMLNESDVKLDLKGAASADYRKIFTLYQGLSMLEALSDRAGQRGVSERDLAQISSRFSAGLDELSTWFGKNAFDAVRLVQGVSASSAQTTAAVARDSSRYVTGPIHEGSLASEVAAFAGDVRFDITIKTLNATKTIAIDLSDMGETPRTFDAVVAHINEALKTAGVETRFGREAIAAEPRTVQAGGKTITLPAGPDRWALSVRGSSVETASFSAPANSDAVYVVQGVGAKGAHEVLKFQADGAAADPQAGIGDTHWVAGRAGQTALPEGVEAVRASAVGPDGALWIVADVSAGLSTQPIKGQSDVVLMKLDSAGQVVTSRALGAASKASGYAIAVDADGRVAVAGSVIGALDKGDAGASASVADSFVAVFDAEGREQWTQRRGARLADEATSVSFGADGRVYVAGRAQSAMPGAVAAGGWDGYVQSFSESRAHSLAPIVATPSGTVQFGGAGADDVQAMTVDGDNLYTAGVEGGRLIVRRFTLDANGAPTLASSRDLGAAGGASISGLAVVDGKVILGGATRNGALEAGTITRAHAGGGDAFVAVLSGDLAAGPDDRLTYYGGEGDDTAADVKIHEGKVWITGVSDRAPGARAEDPTNGYLARLDPLSGAVEWSRTWTGADRQAAPAALAIASGGASVLDRLGLPQGEIGQSDSKRLVDATSLRAGDRFYVTPPNGGRAVAVTIEAKDTLQTLARKIESASGRQLKVTIATDRDFVVGREGDANITSGGVQRLSITTADGRTGAVLTAGEAGRDALAGLGLSPGFIGKTGKDELKTFGLDLPRNLDLSDPKAAKDRIQLAIKALRDAYRSLAPQTAASKATGEVPAYMKAQIANYQAALARLTA